MTTLRRVVDTMLRGLRSGARRSATHATGRRAAAGSKPAPVGEPSQQKPGAPSQNSNLVGANLEYNPSLDGNADPGEVVWTWVPWEEDPTVGKDRPVVIVGRRKDRLIAVPLTSKRHDDSAQIGVGTGPWDREGRPSYARIDRVLDVDPDQVRREGAILARQAFDRVIQALRES